MMEKVLMWWYCTEVRCKGQECPEGVDVCKEEGAVEWRKLYGNPGEEAK